MVELTCIPILQKILKGLPPGGEVMKTWAFLLIFSLSQNLMAQPNDFAELLGEKLFQECSNFWKKVIEFKRENNCSFISLILIDNKYIIYNT